MAGARDDMTARDEAADAGADTGPDTGAGAGTDSAKGTAGKIGGITADDHRPVQHVIDRLKSVAERDVLTLQDLIEAGGRTSFVPAMMIPALLVVSPLSGIPVFSSLMGLTIGLIALQMVIGRNHLWLPRFIMDRRMKGGRVSPALRRISGFAAWIDRHSRKRLRVLTMRPVVKLPQTLAMVSGLAMPFLELVPFSSSILGTAVLFFSAGFLSRDGFYIIGGMAFMALAAMVPLLVWMQVAG